MEPLLVAEPLPIISVLLESVDNGGRIVPICAVADFDAADTALVGWLRRRAGHWPGGIVPIRVRVSFPRHLVFTYDFSADEFGMMEDTSVSGRATIGTATSVTLRERLGVALEEALNARARTVEAHAAKRVARIVLAYGNPAQMGR